MPKHQLAVQREPRRGLITCSALREYFIIYQHGNICQGGKDGTPVLHGVIELAYQSCFLANLQILPPSSDLLFYSST
jgi:hypothetical protein